MFRHVVMFRYAEGTTAEQRAAVLAGLAELPDKVPEIRSYHFGEDAGLVAGNFDLAVVAEFDDAAGYLAYAVNADHQSFIAERIRPVIAQRSAVQFDAG
jgi:hypothetical protein